MSVRNATEADIPALRKLILAAVPGEAFWKYFYPYRTRQITDPGARVEEMLREYLNPAYGDRYIVCVAIMAENNDLATVGIWDTLPAALQGGSSSSKLDLETNDTNMPAKRLHAYETTASETRTRLVERYGQNMFLRAIITHPEYQQLGYGKIVCRHGLQLARQRNISVFTLASSRGYVFYSGLGFADCGHVTVNVEGQSEEAEFKAMVNVMPPEQRRGSLLDIFSFSERRGSSASRKTSDDGRDSRKGSKS